MSGSKSIVKDATKFTASGYISGVCNFVSAIVVRRILDPFLMGLYSELLLVFEYAKYSHLGVINSLDRQIPYYNGRKEPDKVEEAKNAGVSFSLFLSLCCAAGLIAFSYIFKGRLAPPVSTGLKIIAAMVVVQSMSTFYVTLVRTHHLFGPLSRYVILVATLDIFVKLFLGLKFGLEGILWATVVTLTIGIAYLFKRAAISFKISFRIPIAVIRSLLSIGFPLLLAGFTFTILRSIDRIMIIALLAEKDLGYYSIAVMMHSFVFQLPVLIYTVLFPRFYEAFGSVGNDTKKLKGYLEKPTLAFAYLFPILIGAVVLILPVFVNYVLPDYTPGIAAASILLFGTFFISITNMSGYLLVALKKQGMLVAIGIGSVMVSAALNMIFVRAFNMGINGIALGTAITYFLYSAVLIIYAMGHYIEGGYAKIRFLASLYLPLIGVVLASWACAVFFNYNFKNIKHDLGSAALQIAAFLIVTSPLLFYANAKVGLYDRLKNAGFTLFKR